MMTIVKNTKKWNEFKLVAPTLTLGKILALRTALQNYGSAVGNDVLDELNEALTKAKIDPENDIL